MPSLIAVLQGEPEPFGVNASAYRDFLHVKDVAAGFVLLLKESAVGVYNICSGQPVQIEQVVRQIASVFGADHKVVLDLSTSRSGEPAFLVGNNQKLREVGWQPRYRLAEILHNYYL